MVAKVLKPTYLEWQNKRPFQIGASEVGAILGISKYTTPYQVWEKKVNKVVENIENKAMAWGHAFEDGVVKLFEQETGIEVIKSSTGDWQFVREGDEWMSCSPDRTYWLTGKHNVNDWSSKGILECKTTVVDPEKPENEWMLKCWYCQVQWLLLVSELKDAYLACAVFGFERKFIVKHWVANPEFQANMLNIVTKFWHYNVGENIAPAPLTAEDINKLFPTHQEGKSVEATSEMNDKYINLKMLNESIKDLQSQADVLKEELILAVGDAESIKYNGEVLLTYKSPKASKKFDSTAFKNENAELYDKYCVESQGARRFILK